MRRVERRLGVLLVLLLALGSLTACGGGGGAPEAGHADEEDGHGHEGEPEIPNTVRLTRAAISESGIQTWKVQAREVDHRLELTGTVGHDENRLLQVASNLRGRVVEIPVDLGQRVRKGDPVAWIESVELSHAWDEYVKALADLRVSKRAYERARSLLESKAISVGEYQTREAAYLSRSLEAGTLERSLRLYGEPESEILSVRAALDADADVPLPAEGPHRLAVRAPFDGKVIERKVTPGALVEAYQPLLTVADLSSVWVFLKAYEKDLPALEKGSPAAIRADAYPQTAFPGAIDFLGSVVDDSSRTIQVRATVRNPEERLRPGMFVTAQVEIPRPVSEAPTAISVPQAALQSLEGASVVFVEVAPGTFERRAVEGGHTLDGFTEILSGIALGDVVVTEGSFVLKSEFAKATLVEEH